LTMLQQYGDFVRQRPLIITGILLFILVLLVHTGFSFPLPQKEREVDSARQRTSFINTNISNLIYSTSSVVGNGSKYPDLWDNGLVGFLFLIAATISPRLTLVLFASIDWNFWFILGVSFFPEFTLIFLAISRGYHHNNYLLLIIYCVWKIWTLNQKPSQRQASTNSSSQDAPSIPQQQSFFSLSNLLASQFQHTELINLLALSQEAISLLKRQVIQLQHRVALLEMDPNVLKHLTSNQLTQLRELMQSRLQSLDTSIHQTKSSYTDSQAQPCVVCLTVDSCVLLAPCQHKALCDECFCQWQEREETTCPICRTPILSYDFMQGNYVQKISELDYERIGISHTSQELLKLHKYVREHPEELHKLEKCDRKLFEEYM